MAGRTAVAPMEGTRDTDINAAQVIAQTRLHSLTAPIADSAQRAGTEAILNRALSTALEELRRSPGQERLNPQETARWLIGRAREITQEFIWGGRRSDFDEDTGRGRPIAPDMPPISERAVYDAAIRLISAAVEQGEFEISGTTGPRADALRAAAAARMDLAGLSTRYVRPPEAQQQVFDLATWALASAFSYLTGDLRNVGDLETARVNMLNDAESMLREVREGHRPTPAGMPPASPETVELYASAERILRIARLGTDRFMGSVPIRTR